MLRIYGKIAAIEQQTEEMGDIIHIIGTILYPDRRMGMTVHRVSFITDYRIADMDMVHSGEE